MKRTDMIALAFGLALTACASSSSRPVRGPDGSSNWYAIECKRSQANCYDEAGEVCPGGYEVADASGQHGTYVMANSAGVMATPTYRGEMLIRCK